MGTTMRLRFSLIERCAVLLFGGYLLFFLLRHDPYPRAVPGLLVIALPNYAQFNPVALIHQRLGLSAAWFTSGGLLIVLGLLFLVYFRMLHGLRLQSQQDAKTPVENPLRAMKSHEKEQNFVALRVASWIKTVPDRR